MDYTQEFEINKFHFGSGALERIERAKEYGLLDKLQAYIEEAFEGKTPTSWRDRRFCLVRCR